MCYALGAGPAVGNSRSRGSAGEGLRPQAPMGADGHWPAAGGVKPGAGVGLRTQAPREVGGLGRQSAAGGAKPSHVAGVGHGLMGGEEQPSQQAQRAISRRLVRGGFIPGQRPDWFTGRGGDPPVLPSYHAQPPTTPSDVGEGSDGVEVCRIKVSFPSSRAGGSGSSPKRRVDPCIQAA